MTDNSHLDVQETHVLAIASHVTSGYVGNTMATFCMQTLGCEVSAIHTVNYSNHVAYRAFKGRKSTPAELRDIYAGLKETLLDDFDMMLSGYCPSAALVEEVGIIAREQKFAHNTKPGKFFWVLDPVMGDNGRIYVAEDTVPVYQSLLKYADLVLPNQFEAELLSGVKVRDLESMKEAIRKMHKEGAPNVVVTSTRLPETSVGTPAAAAAGQESGQAKLSVIGSTATSNGTPRLFRVTVPALPVFFSGTGDMFAALLVVRLREAAKAAGVLDNQSWKSEDHVRGHELPLAKATEKVLASMGAVLKDTARYYDSVAKSLEKLDLDEGQGEVEAGEEARAKERHLRLTRAAEVRVVRHAQALREPPNLEQFKAEEVVMI